MVIPHIFYSAAGERLQVRYDLNNVPVLMDVGARGLQTSLLANAWIKDGKNTAALHLSWPPHLPYEPHSAHATVKIRIGDPSSEATPPALELTWPGKLHEAYPQRISGEFTVSGFPKLRLWSQAHLLTGLEESDKAVLLRIIEKMESLYAAGNGEAVAEEMSFKTEDVALSTGDDPASDRLDVVNGVGELAAVDGWGIDRVDPSNLRFELVADNRVIWITRPGYQPVLRSKPTKEFIWNMHIYCAKIGDRWQIVR